MADHPGAMLATLKSETVIRDFRRYWRVTSRPRRRLCAIHLDHATRAELGGDAIAPDELADHLLTGARRRNRSKKLRITVTCTGPLCSVAARGLTATAKRLPSGLRSKAGVFPRARSWMFDQGRALSASKVSLLVV